MYKQNPKTAGSNIITCYPQGGKCPMGCNQCYANRKGVYTSEPNVPTVEEVGGMIVRLNDLGDSNIDRDLVIETAKRYKHFFFNTSIPRFDFPGPVVFTANPREEKSAFFFDDVKLPDNLMFVRLRVSSSNLEHVENAVLKLTILGCPVVLTFMAYYEEDAVPDRINYEWWVRHVNSYFCPTELFIRSTIARMKHIGGRLVTYCGKWCKDCRNCELYYWLTLKHMAESGNMP